jgi:hypothetical protein
VLDALGHPGEAADLRRQLSEAPGGEGGEAFAPA